MTDAITSTLGEPSPSIDAAAKEVGKEAWKCRRLGHAIQDKDIADILHRHFASASRAERAWELLVEHEWECERRNKTWIVRQGPKRKELARAAKPIDAILRAAGEEGKDDV